MVLIEHLYRHSSTDKSKYEYPVGMVHISVVTENPQIVTMEGFRSVFKQVKEHSMFSLLADQSVLYLSILCMCWWVDVRMYVCMVETNLSTN